MRKYVFFIALIPILFFAMSCGGSGGSESGGNVNNRINATGRVLSGGVGVSGAGVTVTDMLGIYTWTATTDGSGNYGGTLKCDDTNGCTMRLTATKAGYGTYTNNNVVIYPGQAKVFPDAII